MKNRWIRGSIFLVYLLSIIVINLSILRLSNEYIGLFINNLLAIICTYLIMRNSQSEQIDKIKHILNSINKNRYDYDLAENIKKNFCKDEIAQAVQGFNNTKEASKYVLKSAVELTKIADHVAGQVNDMESATEQIAAASEDIVEGSLAQMKSIDSIFDHIEKVGKSIEDIIGELKRIAAKTEVSVRLTEEGNQYVGRTKESISGIRNTMINYTDSLQNFADSFSQIIKFADIIQAITEQTNLLALNSSIEAARAGEHGRGFAVVASEIGHLSKQSKAASLQISAVIHDMEKKILKLTEEMAKNQQSIDKGIEIAEKTEEAFIKISDSTTKTQQQVTEIGRHMEDIGGCTERVIWSIQTIQKISEGNAADCEQFGAVIEDMNNSFKSIVTRSNELKGHLNELQQKVAEDTMDKYMYQKALDVKRFLENTPYCDLKILREKLNIDEIYVVDHSGKIISSSDPEGIGLDSFKIDPASYEAAKRKEGYTSTPIRKRNHDDQIYKFLHIPYKEGGAITVSLSLQTVLSL